MIAPYKATGPEQLNLEKGQLIQVIGHRGNDPLHLFPSDRFEKRTRPVGGKGKRNKRARRRKWAGSPPRMSNRCPVVPSRPLRVPLLPDQPLTLKLPPPPPLTRVRDLISS